MRKLLLPILVFALVLSSCTDDLTSLNDDPKSTAEAPAEPLFSNAQSSLVTLQNTPNYNISLYKFMAQYWAQTTYADETNYDFTARQIPTNYWSEMHRDVLKDLADAASLLREDELMGDAEKQTKLAQIEIVEVMAWYKLVTTFGDMPYTEALNSENLSPAYTDAATIHASLLDSLNTAVGNLSGTGFSSGDLFYGGSIPQWTKLAHSLRMRLAMTVKDAAPAGVPEGTTAQQIFEDASPKAFTSNADNAIVQFTNTPPHTNPVWENLIQNGRDDYVAANTLIDKMNALNDPRRPIHFTLADTNKVEESPADTLAEWGYEGGVYGDQNTYAAYSHMDNEADEEGTPRENDPVIPLQLRNFEGMVMSYDEVEFLRAEAAALGWATGVGSGLAVDHYENAVRADMEYWNGALSKYQISGADDISAGEISTYLTTDAPFPVAGSQSDKIKAIAEQKWLAFYPVGQQAWVELRRLDHPQLNLAYDSNFSSEDDIPVRFPYPVTEQNLNQENWEQATTGDYSVNKRLFWDTADATSN